MTFYVFLSCCIRFLKHCTLQYTTVLLLSFSTHRHKATEFKHCTKQGMTATASNWSRSSWGRRPHFPFGGLLPAGDTLPKMNYSTNKVRISYLLNCHNQISLTTKIPQLFPDFPRTLGWIPQHFQVSRNSDKSGNPRTGSSLRTRSILSIWKRWVMSLGCIGRRLRPDTNRMKRIRSSLPNDSRISQNHCTRWCDSSISRYLQHHHHRRSR